jgi:hypothetical protein
MVNHGWRNPHTTSARVPSSFKPVRRLANNPLGCESLRTLSASLNNRGVQPSLLLRTMMRNPVITHRAEIVDAETALSESERQRPGTNSGDEAENDRKPEHCCTFRISTLASTPPILVGSRIRRGDTPRCRCRKKRGHREASDLVSKPVSVLRRFQPQLSAIGQFWSIFSKNAFLRTVAPARAILGGTSRFLSLPPPCARSAKPQTH